MTTRTVKKIDRHSDAARELIRKAEAASAAADRAFERFFNGEVATASAASRLRNKAAEAWTDVRLEVRHGDLIEAGDTETLALVEAEETETATRGTR